MKLMTAEQNFIIDETVNIAIAEIGATLSFVTSPKPAGDPHLVNRRVRRSDRRRLRLGLACR